MKGFDDIVDHLEIDVTQEERILMSETWNAALNWAAENAKTGIEEQIKYDGPDKMGDVTKYIAIKTIVDKQSILNGKVK